MIRVTIEMVPMGMEEEKFPMHVIEIWNDLTTTAKNYRYGSYGYRISKKIKLPPMKLYWHKEGRVEDFPRAAKNVVHLLLAVLKDGYEK